MAYDFSKVTVLVVDSQPPMLDLIQGVLRIFGVRQVILHTNGQTALKAFEEYNPDLLIVDWDIEHLNGIEFTKRVRSSKVNPFVPVIFMTAFSSKGRVASARDSGISEFLRKPFTAEALARRIEEVIDNPRKFVRARKFFGPDRRRKMPLDYGVDERRLERPTEIKLTVKPDSGKKTKK